MYEKYFPGICWLTFVNGAKGQTGNNNNLLSTTDMGYLKQLTRDVMDSARISPGQRFRMILAPTIPALY
jgi:hypothetical protein